MRLAVLLYNLAPNRVAEDGARASIAWIDPIRPEVLQKIQIPVSPNLGIFPEHDCALVSYAEYTQGHAGKDWLDVYRLSDWGLRARLPMSNRAHFNVCPNWSTFIPSPDHKLIYIYKANTLGDHWSEDFVCGFDPSVPGFSSWEFRIPECVAGWAACGGPAHAQMLFVADGLEVGRLPVQDFEQKVAFWLGPEDGMGPSVGIGPRPRSHSDLGHARSLVFAPMRTLTVAVCTDGVIHLVDHVAFRYLERQCVAFPDGFAMPIFGAQLDPKGRFLYVGVATEGARSCGLIERVVVHDLDRSQRRDEWVLEEPFTHMALAPSGDRIYGTSSESNMLWTLDTSSGRLDAVMQLDGSPQYIIPAEY